MSSPSPLRVSHFYDWQHVNDAMLDCVLAEFAANGARALSAPPHWTSRFLRDPAFAALLRQRLAHHGLVMQDAHAPWGTSWDLDVEDAARRPAMLAGHRLCLAMLADFGVETYTIHVGSAPNYTNGGVHTDSMQACALQTLEALLPEAEARGIAIAVENIVAPSTAPAVVASLVGSFDSPWIGCCLDLGHAHVIDADAPRTIGEFMPYIHKAWNNKVRLTPFTEIVRMLSPWVVTCHIHDNDATGDEHRLPGDGRIDWPRYLALLATCRRLKSVQNEWHPQTFGYPIGRACRCFDRLSAELEAARMEVTERQGHECSRCPG